MKAAISYLSVLILFTPLTAHSNPQPPASDTPTPLQLWASTKELETKLGQVISSFKADSEGKRWGRSPGHKAVFHALLRYRQELDTLVEMCEPGESPDRLLTVIIDSEKLCKNAQMLTEFIIVPKETRLKINTLTSPKSKLTPLLMAYETRYFTWKKSTADEQITENMKRLKDQLASIEANQRNLQRQNQEIINNPPQNPTINVDIIQRECPSSGGNSTTHVSRPSATPVCPPANPVRQRPVPRLKPQRLGK